MDDKQQYLMQLQILEQEANRFGEQLKIINEQIQEMNSAKANLEKLEKTGEAEMFSEFGKGIFIKGNLKKADLLIDVGGKILVPKKHSEVCKIIDEQILKFEQVKGQICQKIGQINIQVNSIMTEAHHKQDSEKVEKKIEKKQIKKKINKK